MGITANKGPIITFGQSLFGDANAMAGPNMWYQGDALLDPRNYLTYQPGQADDQPTFGWMSTTSMPIIDQVPSALSATNIANAATPSSGTALVLVSSSGGGITVGCKIVNALTGAAVTGLLGIDVNSATNPANPVVCGQGSGNDAGGPVNLYNPAFSISRCLVITTTADDTGGSYTIKGYDIYGFPMTQTVTGVNNTTVNTTKAFKYIASVTPNGTINSTTVSVGTTDIYGMPLRVDRLPYSVIWWGSPQQTIDGGGTGQQMTVQFGPVTLSTIATNQVMEAVMPFDGFVVSLSYEAVVATTTSSKTATFTLQANGSSVGTGGALTLTSNGDTAPTGHSKTGSTASGTNTTFTSGQTAGFIASAVTAFTEGSGTFSMVVQNSDVTGGTFTAAVTSTASATTGDVRGTFATPSASDGTKRLTVFWTPVPANIKTTAGVFGVAQF